MYNHCNAILLCFVLSFKKSNGIINVLMNTTTIMVILRLHMTNPQLPYKIKFKKTIFHDYVSISHGKTSVTGSERGGGAVAPFAPPPLHGHCLHTENGCWVSNQVSMREGHCICKCFFAIRVKKDEIVLHRQYSGRQYRHTGYT